MSFRPPSLTTTWILVDLASKLQEPRERSGERQLQRTTPLGFNTSLLSRRAATCFYPARRSRWNSPRSKPIPASSKPHGPAADTAPSTTAPSAGPGRAPGRTRTPRPRGTARREGKGRPAPPPHQFSIISLMAFAGLWMTSPAAMRFTTVSSSRRITPAIGASGRPRADPGEAQEVTMRMVGGGEGRAKAARPHHRLPAPSSGRLSDWATLVPITRLPSLPRRK